MNHQNVGTNSPPRNQGNIPSKTTYSTIKVQRRSWTNNIRETPCIHSFNDKYYFRPSTFTFDSKPFFENIIYLDSVSLTTMGRGQFEESGRFVFKMLEEENAQVGCSIQYLISIFCWNTYNLYYSGWRPERAHDSHDGRPHDYQPSCLLLRHLLPLLHHVDECLMAGRLANS